MTARRRLADCLRYLPWSRALFAASLTAAAAFPGNRAWSVEANVEAGGSNASAEVSTADCLPIHLLAPSAADRQARLSPIVKAIAAAEAAVVNIQGNKTINTKTASAGAVKQEVSGMGTGVLIDPRGYIITNLHVVQDVPRIAVTLADGRSYLADMLASDDQTDLALIRIHADEPLPTIPFGSSGDLMRGETVIAIGNPFGYQNSVTVGIVSAMHRDIPVNGTQQYHNLIQTSADINPGNSGGPLLNINGDVIGINVAVRVGAQGIGFAIPIDDAVAVMADLVGSQRTGSVTDQLQLTALYDEDLAGWRIDAIGGRDRLQTASTRRSAVRSAAAVDVEGLQVGDVLVQIGESRTPPPLQLQLELLGNGEARELQCLVIREGRPLRVAHRFAVATTTAMVAATAPEDLAWERIGLRLREVTGSVETQAEVYGGALEVTAIRPGSPAAEQRIEKGDLIVGVANWQTPDWKALKWVLESEQFQGDTATRFYVVRNRRTFYVAMQPAGDVR